MNLIIRDTAGGHWRTSSEETTVFGAIAELPTVTLGRSERHFIRATTLQQGVTRGLGERAGLVAVDQIVSITEEVPE